MPGPWDKNLRFWDGATVSATGASTNAYRVGDGAEMHIELLCAGVGSGTSPTLDVKLQDSADGSSYADTGVTFAQLSGTSTVANARQQRYWKAQPGRGYVRLHGTIGGSASPQFTLVTGAMQHWTGKTTAAATTDP